MTAQQVTADHHTRPPIATPAGNALSAAERAFALLVSGPDPLALDGRTIGHGLRRARWTW